MEHCEPDTPLKELSRPIAEMLTKENCQIIDKKKIINYLNTGEEIASEMRLISSLLPNSRILGGITYFTDGFWIWPSYLSEYFLDADLILEKPFLNAIFENNFAIPENIDISNAISFFKENS